MITRALEDTEIKSIFEHIDGTNAKRNETLLIAGIGMALRASELVGLNVGDVYAEVESHAEAKPVCSIGTHGTANGKQVKSYVTIRGETAKFGKERTIRLWDIVIDRIAYFIDWKVEHRESINPNAPLFLSREGGHLTTKALYFLVKKIFSKTSIDQSPHALRKSGSTIFYEESDYDLVATQLFLGHADPSTTKKYIGIPNKKTIETCRRSSNRLAMLIGDAEVESHGEAEASPVCSIRRYGTAAEFTSRGNMVNSSFKNIQTAEMIVELQARGIDMTSAIQQMQAEREPKKIVASAEGLRRYGTASKIIALPHME